LIIKDKVIISHTSEIGGVARESRNFGGPASQKVMVNRGPTLESVQKASGRTFKSTSIQEAVRRTGSRAPIKHAEANGRDAREKTASEERSDRTPDHQAGHGKDSFGPSFAGGDKGGRGRGHGKE
jgi:hypothetical protein